MPKYPTYPRTARRRLRTIVASWSVAVVVLTACGEAADGQPAASSADALPVVVATTSIIGDLVATLVEDDAEVVVLLPPGVDPHGYQPSADDGRVLRQADLVVANGLLLEEGLVSVLETVAEEGGTVLTLADKLDPIEFDGHDEHAREGDDDDHDDDHGDEDPHFWFDPLRTADAVERIAAELASLDTGPDAATWTARGAAFAEELRELDAQLSGWFATIPDDNRTIVTNHDSLGYLADRYDLEVVATVIPGSSTQVEANPQSFAALIGTVEELGIDVVFAENTDATVLAEQLASEVLGRGDLEVEVVRIYTDALGEPGSGAETYVGLLTTTSTLIVEALGGSV
ncbi:MAG: metal ABC transporter solute-binding protein, Zn/Mn family [Nitriliruptoraceae bacterium]